MEEHNPAATQINNFARRDIFRKTLFIHANREGENKMCFLQNKIYVAYIILLSSDVHLIRFIS